MHDIDTLETVLDTIAFGDIQGEDTRNFREANFVKIFRLTQLMELLADHKAELLHAGATMQKRSEKIRSRFLWQRNSLLQTLAGDGCGGSLEVRTMRTLTEPQVLALCGWG